MSVLSICYLLIQSGYWHPGTDTAYYIAVARSVARGMGLRCNGVPAAKVPPLWPIVLAGAMKISASFWFLNLIPTVCLAAAGGLWYRVLRRYTGAGRALAVTLLSGVSFFWYVSAVQLRTEALFCLLFAGAMLLGTQIGEGRREVWRLALVGLLCGLMVGVRWTGLVAWLPVGGAILSGQIRPRWNRQWSAAVVVGVTAVGAFVGFRHMAESMATMRVRSAPAGLPGVSARHAAREFGPALDEDMDSGRGVGLQALITWSELRHLGPRLGSAGRWMSSLLWMPAYLGVTSSAVGWITTPIGWVLIGALGVTAWRHAAVRRWVLAGVLLYCGALVLRWKVPNPRYLVPMLPLLLAGIWLGMEQVRAGLSGVWRQLCNWGIGLFIGSLVLCNGALWAVDVSIARSGDFYRWHLGGENELLVAAARHLADSGVGHGEVAVSFAYENLGRMRKNGHGLRSMAMLTDRQVRSVPKNLCSDPPGNGLLAWAEAKKVRYYLHRPPVSPWRAYHFRIGWWQKLRTGVAEVRENPGWVLYRIDGEYAWPVELQKVRDWPRKVPGM